MASLDGYFCLYTSPSVLSTKLLSPYTDAPTQYSDFKTPPSHSSTTHEIFNYYHTYSTATSFNTAVGILKGRFHSLRCTINSNHDSILLKIRACIILHNFMQRRYGHIDTLRAINKRVQHEYGDLSTISLSDKPKHVTMATAESIDWRERMLTLALSSPRDKVERIMQMAQSDDLKFANDVDSYCARAPVIAINDDNGNMGSGDDADGIGGIDDDDASDSIHDE